MPKLPKPRVRGIEDLCSKSDGRRAGKVTKARAPDDAAEARLATHAAAAAARTAAEVARLTAAGLAGHHDRLSAVKREASRKVHDASASADARADALATISAVHALEPLSLRLGVETRADWRARSRRIRRLVRLALAVLPRLTRELDPRRMAVDVFARIVEEPGRAGASTRPAALLPSGAPRALGSRVLYVRAAVADDERDRLFAWAVAAVAVEAVAGRCHGARTLEPAAAEALAEQLGARWRAARESQVRPVTSSGPSGTSRTTKTGGPVWRSASRVGPSRALRRRGLVSGATSGPNIVRAVRPTRARADLGT